MGQPVNYRQSAFLHPSREISRKAVRIMHSGFHLHYKVSVDICSNVNSILVYFFLYKLTPRARAAISAITELTNYMEQSPSQEGNRSSASQKISRILWYPKVYHRIHKCSPPVTILTQNNPVHSCPSYFLSIYFNIIIPSTSGSSNCFLSLRFPHQFLYENFKSHIRATCLAHLILLDLITLNNIW